MMNDEIFPPGDIQRSSKPTVTWNFVEEAGRQTELKQPVSNIHSFNSRKESFDIVVVYFMKSENSQK